MTSRSVPRRREFGAAGCNRVFDEIILLRDLETSIMEMREVAGISKAATYRYLEPDGRPRQRARHNPEGQGA